MGPAAQGRDTSTEPHPSHMGCSGAGHGPTQAMGSVRNDPSKMGLGCSVPAVEAGGGWAQHFPCRGGGPATSGHPLGCFAEHSVAQTWDVWGSWRENLAGEGNRPALLSAGSSQDSGFKCQSLVLLSEMSLQHPLGTPCSRDASPLPEAGHHATPLPLAAPRLGGAGHPPRLGVVLCLALLRAPLLCLCSQCPSLVSPSQSSVPKAAARGFLSWWWLLPNKVFLRGA